MVAAIPAPLPAKGDDFVQQSESNKNAETLFETRSVAEIREVERTTRRDIEVKKEELRQLVGASYRDLIASADTILAMAKTCEDVVGATKSMTDGFNGLSARIKQSTAEPKRAVGEDDQREELYSVGSRVKYLVDTPEMIWGYLDEHDYMESAGRYLRASQVHKLLQKGSSRKLLGSFPLLKHQWPLVENFKTQIVQRARNRLQQEGLGTHNFAVALSACAYMEGQTSAQVLDLYFGGRTGWVRAQLAARLDPGAKEVPPSELLAGVLRTLAHMVQRCVSQAGELFLQTASGVPPAFFATALEELSDNMIFGGLVDQEAEVAVWKEMMAGVSSRLAAVPAEEIAAAAVRWVESCAAELSGAEGRALMAAAGSASELAAVEAAVRAEIKTGEPCAGSAEWLEATLGLRPQAPWESMCELVLRRPLDVWAQFFDAAFTARAKELVDAAFAGLSVEDKVVACMREVDYVAVDHAARLSLARSWPEQPVALPAALAGGAGGASASERLNGMRAGRSAAGGAAGADGWRARVQELRGELDEKLEGILKGALSLLAAPEGGAGAGGAAKHRQRAEELEPYIQRSCHAAIAAVAASLEAKLGALAQGLPADRGEVPLAAVEKALFLGRLCAAVGQHTSWLRIILGPPSSWQDAKTLAAAVAGGASGAIKRAGGARRRFARGEGPRDGGLGAGLLAEVQAHLARVSLAAHEVWVEWTAARLGAGLAASLARDSELAASAAPRVWEETVVQQGAGGAGGEMRFKLPGSPSPYALTFLLSACRELQCAGAHLVDLQVLRLLEWELGRAVLRAYEGAVAPRGALDGKGRLSDKGALQVLMDVRFLADVLSGGADTRKTVGAGAGDAGGGRSAGPAAHKREVALLEDTLTSRLDPIDWATYEPYLWANEQRYYQRCAVLFGSLIQLRRLYPATGAAGAGAGKPSVGSETNTLSTWSGQAPRFMYLPISTPTVAAAAQAGGPGGGYGGADGQHIFGQDGVGVEEQGALKSIMGSVGRGIDGTMETLTSVNKLKEGMGAGINSLLGGGAGLLGGWK